MKKVSIIIPVYNVESYISECIDSVIGQTYQNLEVIIVDDGSTDNSGRICDEYAKQDNRIKVIHTKNQGSANAKNEALERITGEYFCFVDSDDYYEKNFVEIMLKTALEQKSQIVQCQFRNIFIDKTVPSIDCNKIRLFTNYGFLIDFSNRWVNTLFWNKIFSISVLKNVRFLQHRYIDDEFFTYKLVLNSQKITEIPDVLYNYRMRKSSATKTEEAQKKILLDQSDYVSERYEYIKKNYPALKSQLLEYMVTNNIWIFKNPIADEEVINYTKNNAKKYIKDILFFNYDFRVKYTFLKLYFLKKNIRHKNLPVSPAINYRNYFE